VQLTFDADVEAFRSEFVAFLDEHLPAEAEASERSRSTSHIPEWAGAGSGCSSTVAGCCRAIHRNSVAGTRLCFSSSCTARSFPAGGSISLQPTGCGDHRRLC